MQTQIMTIGSSVLEKKARCFAASLKDSTPVPTMLVEETLVVDDRTSCRPAQAVENKLSRILGNASVGISHLRLKGLLAARKN